MKDNIEVKDNKQEKSSAPISVAREKAMELDFNKYKPQKPSKLGVKVLKNYNLELLVPFMDWKMFFYTWGVKGKFPDILKLDNRKGKEARRLYDEGQKMLQEIIREQKIEARATLGLFPAARSGDDILIYKDDNRNEIVEVLPMLRQQQGNPERKKNYLSLSDFITSADSQYKDYLGLFAVSTGFGAEEHIKQLKKENDTYNSVMFRLLCDRLTEAFSEKLHYEVRKEYWGYARNENSDIAEMLGNRYEGIRPAPGYPPCPDHRLKEKIFKIMDVENNIGIKLTNSYAMHPASSECGCYIAHPDSRYFSVGKIDKDQILNYAQRQNISPDNAEILFKPYLNYKPNN